MPPKTSSAKSKPFLLIEQYRSAIRTSPHQRAVLRGLGVTMRKARSLEDSPAIRGMVNKIPHLVRIIEPRD